MGYCEMVPQGPHGCIQLGQLVPTLKENPERQHLENSGEVEVLSPGKCDLGRLPKVGLMFCTHNIHSHEVYFMYFRGEGSLAICLLQIFVFYPC